MILCIGTTPTLQRTMIFDQVRVNDVNRASEVIEYASGKSINVARVVHTLGYPVTATGFLGGERGRVIRKDLDRSGIRHDFVDVHPQTRLCVTFVERSNYRATELIEETPPIEPDAWARLDDELDPLRSLAKVVVYSGSLPTGAPTDFYARQVAKRCDGQKLVLDGRGLEIREALLRGSFILKLNLAELAATAQVPVITDKIKLLDAMNKTRPKGNGSMLVVTLGASGVVAGDGLRFWTVAIPKVKAVSAIGSGDAFAGGMAVGIVENRSWPDTLKLAAACGVANALTPLAGHIRLEDVRKLESQIVVRDGLHFPVD